MTTLAARICALASTGLTAPEIAAEVGCHHSYVRVACRRAETPLQRAKHGRPRKDELRPEAPPPKPPGRRRVVDRDALAAMYAEGYRTSVIADRLGCSAHHVRHLLCGARVA